uniref:C2H2-type domain-containing protein n=1 Tax=Neogobius melanostomus TaxID=47308 RepID=A0A8C6S808_9GOBI
MADEEAERDRGPEDDVNVVLTGLTLRLQELRENMVKESQDSPTQSSFNYCQDFCRALLESAGCWRIEDEPMPVVRVYMLALRSYAETSAYLSMECDSVPLVVERLAMSFVELLLSQKELPEDVWNEFISCVQFSHGKLQETGLTQLSMLWTLGQQEGVWANPVLQGIMSGEELPSQKIEQLLVQEGYRLLELRVKQLIKDQQLEKAARLAKTCSESTLCEGKANFKQMYLVCLCLCTTIQQDQLMEELSKVDCHDVLEMICNLESDGDEKGAFTLCSAFLSRQLVQADAYCAWELTLFWSKLLKRLEPSEKAFLDKCCQMSLLSKTVYHILFLIKVIQSEIKEAGLPVCIEMCIRALRMQTEDGNTKATVCKTVTCLLPNDLEVKRACQLTQFLLEPTVDSYYAVETLYNEPDQKLDEDKMAVPNSLRCELLLVFKTQWPFDPEFWDWKTLKRRCLALMGEEASIVSSIDSLNDTDDAEEEDTWIDDGFLESADKKVSGTYELTNQMDKKQKNREMKKLREKGFISARFRNWQVYMQYCVLCDKEFLGHRIIRHAQIHFDHGVYSCPICTQSFNSKETLIPHVTSHVKQSSKDRLTAMKANRKLSNPKTAAPMIASLICKTENEGSKSGGSLGQNFDCIQNSHGRFSEEPSEEVVCPVGTCKKTFKFYRNLIAHVKAHRDDEEAKSYLDLHSNKVVCQYCRRHFVSVNHLNDHLQVHCGTKPYICIQLNCKASFLSNTELLVHRKTHSHFKARCMFSNCGKIFSEAFKLYDHEAKHYKTFTCKFVDCGRVFHTQQQLDLHHNDHTIKKESKEPTLQSGSSLNKTQIILDASTIKETERSPEKYRAETVSVGKPETLESLLKASQTPIRTVDRFEIKTEVQDEVSIDEASPSVNLQTDLGPADMYCKQETPPNKTLDHLKPSLQYQKHISPFEATINKMLREKTLLRSELQFFSSSFNQGLIKYGGLPVSNATRPTSPLQTQPTPMVTQSIHVATTQPNPMATTQPIPIATTQPNPMAATTQPNPMAATTQPNPMAATTQPNPMAATTQPNPMAATTQPNPMAATTQPNPMAATTQPNPMAATTQPNPMAATTQPNPLAATTQPNPLATTQPNPLATTQPNPLATTQPNPMARAYPIAMATTQFNPMATTQLNPMATTYPIAMATTQPNPMVTTHPIPMATTRPNPMATTRPNPTATTRPNPTATTRPNPTATTRPNPTATTRPNPTATTRPNPTATTRPNPTATTRPNPTATTRPVPTATTRPVPTATTRPVPMATTQSVPMATTQSVPMATTQPVPMATTQPVPMATTQPIPKATTQSVPMVTTQPVSMVTTQSVPMVTTKPFPMAETKPIPLAATTQHISIPATHPLHSVERLQDVPPAVATSATQEGKINKSPPETILRERYHCPFDLCTRNYSCYKSVSKHIKTSHPDMYAIRRIPRCEIKVTYVSGPPPTLKPFGGTQKKSKVILPPPHTNIVNNSNAEKLHSPINTTGPQLMENVLNPIVVAQLKTTASTSSLQTLNQPVFPMASQQQHKCGTAMMNSPRPSESITASIVPKGLTESNSAVTQINSRQVSSTRNGFQPFNMPTPTSSPLRPPRSQAMWSAAHQNQQIPRGATSQLHPPRKPTSLPLPSDHRSSASIDPNLILTNSLTKAYKEMQSSALYRPSANAVLPPKTPIKTEEESLPLWPSVSEINHGQLGTPPQTHPNRAMGAASVPLPFKDHPRGTPQTAVSSNQTSNTRCSPLPLYTPQPASPNAALTSVGKHKTSKSCQSTFLPLIQETQTSAKHSKILPTAMYNTNVPIPAKGPPIPVESNDNTAAIQASSMQISCKPPAPANIKIENCQANSPFTLHEDSTELINTNTVQNPHSQPLQNQATADDNPENGKPARKRNKVRWPAIVRDGKVFVHDVLDHLRIQNL